MESLRSTRVPLGVVLGNRSATPLEFWIAIYKDQVATLDDVVVLTTEVPQYGKVTFFGVITEMERYLEDSKYAIDSLLYREGRLPGISSWIAKVSVTRIEPEDAFLPPRPGDLAFKADEEEVEKAFYFDSMKRRIKAGLLPSGKPFYLNLDFLDGEKGAHISITGISGVATKTSYATFLLYSIMNLFHGTKRRNYKALVFNVKGEDLLYISYRNKNLKEEDRKAWELLGADLSANEGFAGVTIYAPPRSLFERVPDVSDSIVEAKVYGWNLYLFARDKLLKFAFMDDKGLSDNVRSAIEHITERLSVYAEEMGGPSDHLVVREHILTNLDDLYRLLREDELKGKGERLFFRPNESYSTIRAVLRRFERVKEDLRKLISVNLKPPDLQDSSKLILIDIHSLPAKAQSFVTGAVLYNLYLSKSESGKREPIFFVLLDELNKYAPADGYTPIKDVLIDIAERGRSLGLILIGAQQTASQVETRILANCSVKVLGRMDPAEITKPIYQYLSPVMRQRATILKPGRMIVYQPDCPTPVLVKFPMPLWATRRDEVDIGEIEDEFI